MAHARLSKEDVDGKRRLSLVAKKVGNVLDSIDGEVREVLRGVEPGRKGFLERAISGTVRDRIKARQKRAQKKSHEGKIVKSTSPNKKIAITPVVIFTPAMRRDALRHEQSLLNRIPEEDR